MIDTSERSLLPGKDRKTTRASGISQQPSVTGQPATRHSGAARIPTTPAERNHQHFPTDEIDRPGTRTVRAAGESE